MTEQNTAGTAPATETAAASGTVSAPETAPAITPEAVPEHVDAGTPDPAAPKERRKLFAALRWTAAVLVFAAVGTGVAYGISRAERTHVPGLSTLGDGRWTYPTLSRPALPVGAPLAKGPDNRPGTHYVPLTGLLLPAPEGARPDDAVKPDKDGSVSVDAFLAEYAPDRRAKLKEYLEYEGLRQLTGRGWTTADGTRTHAYLLRFHAEGFVDAFAGCSTNMQLAGAPVLEMDLSWRDVVSKQEQGAKRPEGVSLFKEPGPANGDEQTKLGCIEAGDVLSVIIQTRKGEVATVPFHQTVILQSQLLS
ncbi:hypothetical protein [Streptomyces vinaceus]|uniref:hypothetical protein n=1 Tax=Streptomyces vinaceus TaxID=1960 RepID=UPI0019BBDCE4|nr:hypothetical protein [Streptomyces vinaceus]GHE59632.1 hypothetical protein GCM10017778_50260 [Streptomyces vinaceus]